MVEDGLPREVRELVQRHTRTPAHLEALVGVARDPARTWRPAEVAAGKYPDPAVIAGALSDLAEAGLLRSTGTGDGVTYQVAPGDDALHAALRQLVDAYQRVPVQLMRAVYTRPSDAVQSFADAFRLQKPT